MAAEADAEGECQILFQRFGLGVAVKPMDGTAQGPWTVYASSVYGSVITPYRLCHA